MRSRSYTCVALGAVLQRVLRRMVPRKSQPRIVGDSRGEDTIPVERFPSAPAQFAQRRAVAVPDKPPAPVIPFARPRAIAAMPATFRPAPSVRPLSPTPMPIALKPAPPPPPPRLVIAPSPSPRPTAVPLTPVAVSDGTVQAPPVPSLVVVPRSGSVPNLSRWAAFEKIGLVADKLDPKTLQKHAVTAYRLLGFGILTVIVFVLVGYIATTTFFYMSDRWIVPQALSPTDDKVLALEGQLAERQNQRDQLAGMLDDAERQITVQQAFQVEFAKAIASDLDDRRSALAKMHELATAAASTRVQIRKSNSAFASASQVRMAQEYQAGLIDRTAMLSGKFQLAQITNSNLSLVERQAEYETRAVDLEAQTRSLEALLANKASGVPMTYDVLKIKQEYEASRLATQKAIETRDTLKTALARQDKLVETLQHTSFLRAMNDHAQVAFVPYDNLGKISKGAELYGCKLGMIFCHKVGTVVEVLPGEVQFKHPQRDKMLRGQMVELKLADVAAATDDVLFVGGKPLLL
jgi:hypothetical protein